MKKLLIFLGLTSVAAVALAQALPTSAPTDISGAISDLSLLGALVKAKAWLGGSLVVSQLLIFAVKYLDQTNTAMKKWGSVLVTVLAALGAVLSAKLGGLAWSSAVLVFVSTGLGKFANDILSELGYQAPTPLPAPQIVKK